MNENDIADYGTGLVVLIHSLPPHTVDANGDDLAEAMMQTLRDMTDELGATRSIDWTAAGEPADAALTDATAVARVQAAGAELGRALENLPGWEASR